MASVKVIIMNNVSIIIHMEFFNVILWSDNKKTSEIIKQHNNHFSETFKIKAALVPLKANG